MNTEKKIIGLIGVATIAILIGGVFFLTKSENPSVPESEIVARNGLHWHPTLKIYIKGEPEKIPKNLGIAGQIHQEIHTHDESGTIHMEMKGLVTKDETKLSNFFRVWGKDFTSNKLFDKINGPEGTVKMRVNGQDNKDFENYLMKDKDSIEVRYE